MAGCSTVCDHWVGSVGSRLYTNRQTDRQKGRQTEGRTDTDRQTEGRTDRLPAEGDEEVETERDIHRERQTAVGG